VAYHSQLSEYWNQKSEPLKVVFETIRLGFYEQNPQLQLLQCDYPLDMFRDHIGRMTIPGIRMWYEGLRKNGRISRLAFKLNVEFKAYTTKDERFRISQFEIAGFVRFFMAWTKSEKGKQFLGALCGVTGFSPLTTLSHRFVLIADRKRDQSDDVIPNILLPKQRRVLFFVTNPADIFDGIADQVFSGQRTIGGESDQFMTRYEVKLGKVDWS
jgi:hypothetical protein